MRACLGLLAALTLSAPAAAQDLCPGLQRIAAAAREAEPFASLRGVTQLLPPYRVCEVRSARPYEFASIECSRNNHAPASLEQDAVAAQVRACLGAELLPLEPIRRRPRLVTAELEITIESFCDEECHVGRMAILSARRRPPR